MGGLGVLLILAIYIWFARLIAKLARQFLPHAIALSISLLLVTLPFIDALAGRVVLAAKCAYQGSIDVKFSVQGVEGIGVEHSVSPTSPSDYGYQFVEGGYAFKNGLWGYDRAEKDSTSNQVVIKNKVAPEAIYLLKEGPSQNSTYFLKTQTSVIEISSGRKLASFNWFAFHGGLAEQLMMILSDAGPSEAAACGNVTDKHEKTVSMLHAALKPAVPTSNKGSSASE